MTLVARVTGRLLLAPVLLLAAAVLVKGYSEVGDGFSAGVIASVGVVLQYVVLGREEADRVLPLRLFYAVALGGLALALIVAFLPAALGLPILRHWPEAGAEVTTLGTLELITPVAFDLGIFGLVVGSVVTILRTFSSDEERDGP